MGSVVESLRWYSEGVAVTRRSTVRFQRMYRDVVSSCLRLLDFIKRSITCEILAVNDLL